MGMQVYVRANGRMVDQLTRVSPTLFMRLLRLFIFIGDHARERYQKIDKARHEAAALKPGTKVYLHCGCPGEIHSGYWTVVKYNYDPDDYKITRKLPDGKDETDFAVANTLELIEEPER